MSGESKLAGKKTIVTGSATGIGREIALEFARQGADVVLHYNLHDDGVKSAIKEIESLGRRVTAIKANFENIDEVLSLAEQATKFLGSVDCLVNNAGITFNKPFAKTTTKQFDLLLNVNLRAQFFLSQRIVESMTERGGGAICNITSIHGIQGAPEHALYAATKGAIIAYTRALATELAHKHIRVNAIAPGWILVDSHRKAVPDFNEDAARERARNKVPVGRYGVPADVAKLAAFLCSDDASFIVGQTIVADGGTTALMSLLSDFRAESKARFGAEYVPDA
jgi:3-oxoacyl-[acyl-carrier protein] reductase